MRLRLLGFILLSYVALVAATQAAPPTPIIKIDASTLADGPVATITNAGSITGTFTAVAATGMGAPVVGTVAGKKALTFNGSNGYTSKPSFTAPDTVTAGNAWSVATWIYNPSIGTDNDCYFQWARKKSSAEKDGRVGQLYYQNSAWGAAPHGGNWDMGWGRLNAVPPAAGVWHHIAVTYDGAANTGTEIVYVDGVVINAHIAKPLDLFPGCQVLVGLDEMAVYAVNDFATLSPANWQKSGLSGSIASLKMWDSALSADDVLAEAGGTAFLNTGTITAPIMNNSFESYTFGGNNTNMSRDVSNNSAAGVYWTGFSYHGGTPANTSINHTMKFAHADRGAGNTSQWNNGNAVDGYAVLALECKTPSKIYACQPVWGLKPNTDYKIWGFFNSRKAQDNFASLEIKMDGVDILSPSPKRI